jgi:hypothetical protein
MLRRMIGLEIAELVLCCGIGSEEDACVYIYRFLGSVGVTAWVCEMTIKNCSV